FVKAEKFYTKDSCTGCGLGESLCPVNNVKLKDGKPVWDDFCTHCMACICHCPTEAIEYGKTSVGKVRYTCPED
ncbi:MAG: EFR1 family ferrodoxin, partial [Firmicutes bacterium]|nr:EFR1 family ferrodoxin [Bacillota bacterium]